MAIFVPRFVRQLRDVLLTAPADGEVLTYDSADEKWKNEAGGGGGGPPTGAAGGVLGGTYPNPGFDVDMATQAELDAHVTDITDAHDATAVSVAPFGTIAATQVQAALEEIVAEAVTDLGPAVILAPASSARNVIQPPNGDTIHLILKSHADWQTGAAVGDMLDFEDEDGNLIGGFYRNQGTGEFGFFTYADIAQLGSLQLLAGGFYVSVLTGATRNPIWIQTQDGDNLFFVTPSGIMVLAAHAAPADAALAAGELGKWYDQTNGAAKIMHKGKTANGTVVTFEQPSGVVYVVDGIDVALADGGTGASTAAGARTNLGLVIGTDVASQADLDADEAALAAHLADASDAHDASAVSFSPTGTIAATDVQAAIAEVASEAGGGGISPTLFDANTILKADSDDTPVALTMGASTILARLAAGNIKAATPAEIATLLGVSAFIQTLLDDADVATARATLQSHPYRQAGYKVGEYYTGECIPNLGGTGANSVGRCMFIPFIVDVTTTFDRIAIYITANGSAGALQRMGIYNDNAGVPGTVLLDAGTVATDAGAAAIKPITISQQLTPGRYWLCSTAQTAAATATRAIATGSMQWLGGAWNAQCVYVDGITGAFASAPAVAVAGINPTVVALRALSSP